ncbi:MAG: radical SAM protein [Candidatus Alcyoniella australis]|nr:radical SAM protein [Candidatus Alcyoniella australis]
MNKPGKVTLIQPPLHHGPLFLPAEVGTRFSCFPALGLLTLRAGIKKRLGIQAAYLDADALGLSVERAAQLVAATGPDVVGISMDSFTMKNTIALARAIKRLAPRTVVAVGGVHPTIYPRETAALEGIDWAFCGEADHAFPEALEAHARGALPNIRGVAYQAEGEVVFAGPAEPIENLDDLPFPDWTGVELTPYFSAPAAGRPVLSMITSRGCPFRCTFCDRPRLAHGLRTCSAEAVVEQMLELKRIGAREISIYDDNLTADRKRALAVAEMLAQRGAPIGFDLRSRVDTIDAELLDVLARAGCRRIYFGVESGDPQVLKNIKKGIDLDQTRRVFEHARRRGIRRLAYFMFGLPGEGLDAAQRTIEFARSLKADYYLFEIFIPMPCTEAYDSALADGTIERDYWAGQAADPQPDFTPPSYPGLLDPEQLARINSEAYRKVVLRPGYVLRSLLAVRTPQEIALRVRAALDLLRMRGGAA